MIDPVRETPHGVVNLAELHRSTGIVLYGGLELLVEVAIVQKNIWIMVPTVEVPFNRLERLDNAIQLLISCEDDKSGVGTRGLCDFGGINGHAASREDLVMFFADFPVKPSAAVSIGAFGL